jgi:hypothetical protein
MMPLHPSQADNFQWDEGNVSELARHGIAPVEVVQVLENDPVWSGNRRGRAGNWQAHGRTDGGRVLTIIRLMFEDGTFRPITG